MAMALMTKEQESDALQRMFAAVAGGDLAAAQGVLDELMTGANPDKTIRMAIGPFEMPVLGLTFAEAEAVGADLWRWGTVHVPFCTSLTAGHLGWADLVQFVNRASRAVIAARVSGEESA